jgi:hypothetical protein
VKSWSPIMIYDRIIFVNWSVIRWSCFEKSCFTWIMPEADFSRQSRKKFANCDISDRQRDPCTISNSTSSLVQLISVWFPVFSLFWMLALYRRLRGDMIETFKIITGIYDNEVTAGIIDLDPNTRTRGHSKKIKKKFCKINLRKFSLR